MWVFSSLFSLFFSLHFFLFVATTERVYETLTTQRSILKQLYYTFNAPCEMSGDKTLSLQSTITQLGLTNPYIATPEYGTNLMSNQYEARDFVLVNSFKTTGDKVENGINTASTSAPIEIDLTFSQATSNKQLITFVEQANTLYIKNDGISSMVKG